MAQEPSEGVCMKIGIDISQIVYERTGVANYVKNIVETLVKKNPEHEYVLFGASLRKRYVFSEYKKKLDKNIRFVVLPLPPTLLDFFWNTLHVFPIELFIGSVDIFWSSDWTQPPLTSAIGVTTIHDVSFLKFPETFATYILDVQKRRLERVKQTCTLIFCDSETTKQDVHKFLGIDNNKLQVVYPGL